MKKILVTILALIYLTSSIGATVHLHYCMDKLVTWGLGANGTNKKSCSYCGMNKPAPVTHCNQERNGCCKDDQKQIKLDNDQKINEVSFHLAPNSSEAIAYTFSDYSFEYISSLTEEYPLTHAPPRPENISLFIRNCVFLI